MNNKRGFTIVEMLVSIVVLTVGLLGLMMSSALTTRMMARGQRSAVAAMFAAKKLEELRMTACTVQTAGADTLKRGSAWVAINSWSFSDLGNKTWRLSVTSTYQTARGQIRADKSETEVSCLF